MSMSTKLKTFFKNKWNNLFKKLVQTHGAAVGPLTYLWPVVSFQRGRCDGYRSEIVGLRGAEENVAAHQHGAQGPWSIGRFHFLQGAPLNRGSLAMHNQFSLFVLADCARIICSFSAVRPKPIKATGPIIKFEKTHQLSAIFSFNSIFNIYSEIYYLRK